MLGRPSSAKTSINRPAASPWTPAAGHRSARATYVASRAALERSAQKALERAEEAQRKRATKRTLAFDSRPPGSGGKPQEHKSSEQVTPPTGPHGSPAADPAGKTDEQQRIAGLERKFRDLSTDMDSVRFNMEGLATDLSTLGNNQERATNEILSLLKGQGSEGLREQDKQVESQEDKQTARQNEFRRMMQDGKVQAGQLEFNAFCELMGKTSAKVSPSPPPNSLVVGSGSGFSSQGFGSGFEDFPTTTDGHFSPSLLAEQRAKATNKTTMTKAFASESAFHEYVVSKGFLDRDHVNFPFFSTLIFQTRELVLRDGTWATSKAYLTRLWTVQANEGLPWLTLVGRTSAKRYVDSILDEFKGYINSVKFSLLNEKFEKAYKTKKGKDKGTKFPGSAKQTKENDFFCEHHNSWFPEATHKNKCRKVGQARPGDRNGP